MLRCDMTPWHVTDIFMHSERILVKRTQTAIANSSSQRTLVADDRAHTPPRYIYSRSQN